MSKKIKIDLNKIEPNSLVICGFPGIGKSFLTKEYGTAVSDSDSSHHPKEGFPANYLKHIEGLLGKKRVITISTHKEVLDGIEEMGINHIIVYPKRGLKNEYLKRYEDRGSPEAFVKLMGDQWEKFQDDIRKPRNNAWRIELNEGEFLSDYIK